MAIPVEKYKSYPVKLDLGSAEFDYLIINDIFKHIFDHNNSNCCY